MTRADLKRPRVIAGVLVALLFVAIGFVPLFDGPGYEHAVATGLIVPTIVAMVVAFESFAGRSAIAARAPFDSVVRGMATGALLALVALLAVFLHALRVGLCDPLGGVATFGLTAFSGCLLAGGLAAAFSIATAHFLPARRARRRWAMFFAWAAPLATALTALGYFYFTPAVYAFDPFVGFFSGTLYDEVVDAYRPLLTYRAGTAATLLALVVGAAGLQRDEHGRLSIARRRVLALASVFALVSASLIWFGPDLGHRTTANTLRRSLGGERSGPRCDVVYPRAMVDSEAALLVRDCEEALAAVEARLGVAGPARVTAFFFRDADQKRALIGAADTYVAKPWRREVYLQVAPYPHPVLGHELAHVVAGNIARGPLRIAGGGFGLFPNPGLIEGIAVAASPDRDELTPSQWAHAMKQLGILPALHRTFGGGFLTQNSAMAYTIAGAFISWLYETDRGAGVRAWYGGASFDAAFGASFATLETEFRAALDKVPLPPETLSVAKARFDRPAIWGRRCPHVVERLRDEFEGCRDDGDLAGADTKLKQLLELDAHDSSARLERAKLAAARGDDKGYVEALRALEADSTLSTTWRNRVREALGDEALRAGDLEGARAYYDKARGEVLDEDWGRTLDVKSWATTTKERAALIGRLLVGRGPRREKGDETTAATIAIARFVERVSVGVTDATVPQEDLDLGRYLLARRLVEAKAYADAEALLVALPANALVSISPKLVREAARLRLMIACLSPKETRAARVDEAIARYRLAPPANAGRREGIERFAARCRL